MQKRLLALSLALLLLILCTPIQSFASETGGRKLFSFDKEGIEIIEFYTGSGASRIVSRNDKGFDLIIDKLNNFTYTATEEWEILEGWYVNIAINYADTHNESIGVGPGSVNIAYDKFYMSTDRNYFSGAWVQKILAEGKQHPYTDISGNVAQWGNLAIQWAWENGVILGTQSTTFSPNLAVDRAMFMTMLYRLEDEPFVDGAQAEQFLDITDQDAYYYDAVLWAKQNNIINGTSPTTFEPNKALTREQAALILYRYGHYKNKSVEAKTRQNIFQDIETLSEESKVAILSLSEQKVILGKSATVFDPKGSATRAQTAVMLYRLMNN